MDRPPTDAPECVTLVLCGVSLTVTRLLTTVNLPEVVNLPPCTFKGFSDICTVQLTNCKVVGRSAFEGCTSLKSVAFLKNVGEIQSKAFSRSGITTVVLNECTKLGDGAFSNCKQLSVADLHNCTIARLEDYTFDQCVNLSTVHLPPSVFYVGDHVFTSDIKCLLFNDDTAMTPTSISGKVRVLVVGGNPNYASVLSSNNTPFSHIDCDVIYVKGRTLRRCTFAGYHGNICITNATVLQQHAFCKSTIKHVTLNNMEVCAKTTFSDAQIYKLQFGSGVGTTGDFSDIFTRIASLTVVDLSQWSATWVSNGMFHNVTTLESIVLPKGCTEIGALTFANCTNLNTILNLEVIQVIDFRAFYNCKALTAVDLPLATALGICAFLGCSNLESITIPSVSRLKPSVLRNCPKLETLHAPKVFSIDESALRYNRSLVTLDCPKLHYLGMCALEDCSNLQSLYAPELRNVHRCALKNCGRLVWFGAGRNLNLLHTNAFIGCFSLSHVDCLDNPDITIQQYGEGFESAHQLPHLMLANKDLSVHVHKNTRVVYTQPTTIDGAYVMDSVHKYTRLMARANTMSRFVCPPAGLATNYHTKQQRAYYIFVWMTLYRFMEGQTTDVIGSILAECNIGTWPGCYNYN